jgi:hypothetical protein
MVKNPVWKNRIVYLLLATRKPLNKRQIAKTYGDEWYQSYIKEFIDDIDVVKKIAKDEEIYYTIDYKAVARKMLAQGYELPFSRPNHTDQEIETIAKSIDSDVIKHAIKMINSSHGKLKKGFMKIDPIFFLKELFSFINPRQFEAIMEEAIKKGEKEFLIANNQLLTNFAKSKNIEVSIPETKLSIKETIKFLNGQEIYTKLTSPSILQILKEKAKS